MESGEVYEVRYGPTLKNVAMLVGSIVLTIGCLLPEVPLIIRVPGVALFGVGSFVFLAFMFVRRVAFRVDAQGITVAGNPLRYRTSLLFVPWSEVEAVVLWKQHSASNLPHVGVKRYKDSPEHQQGGRGSRLVLRAVAPHVPVEIVLSSRAVNGWRLNRDRLASAVAHFAPDTEVVDLG
ncbi:hypothetical protein [Actinomadura sp. 7K507]|uniref:hypothetical protein n=1 Tax=Actinomadura sp. 7K507 TaxID=2530365 RepID=UPI0010446801|nr:hypothetical protein [Actinomadura sp. 7K507]TDC81759.1 hypothetical protein E1285_32020 [Actinomadura sp. 7K507]